MSLNPQCYANKPAGITDANTKAYTGLNSCLSSCKNGLRATYWARNMVSRLRWSWTGCMADLSGRKCNNHLSVLMCDAFELWCWHDMWSGRLLCESRLFSAVFTLISRDIITRPRQLLPDSRNVNREKQQQVKQLLNYRSVRMAGLLV